MKVWLLEKKNLSFGDPSLIQKLLPYTRPSSSFVVMGITINKGQVLALDTGSIAEEKIYKFIEQHKEKEQNRQLRKSLAITTLDWVMRKCSVGKYFVNLIMYSNERMFR